MAQGLAMFALLGFAMVYSYIIIPIVALIWYLVYKHIKSEKENRICFSVEQLIDETEKACLFQINDDIQFWFKKEYLIFEEDKVLIESNVFIKDRMEIIKNGDTVWISSDKLKLLLEHKKGNCKKVS